jgi:hypothetical protein
MSFHLLFSLGTPEERGLINPVPVHEKKVGGEYETAYAEEDEAVHVTYDLPFGMKFLRR